MITDVSEKTVLKFPLPEPFQEEMRSLLDEEYEQYVKSFDDPRSLGLRVNTLRLTREECRDRLPCDTWPVPWIANGLFYEDHVRLSKDPYYNAGLYYLQEPSAMTPASLLPVKPGDMVLDLCAAPGGKSTELGARLRGEGMLVANDISNSRAKGLLKNLELFGIANLCVTSEPPERLAAVFPGFFDSILIDAPCSGEGMFRKEEQAARQWSLENVSMCAQRQQEILQAAACMLRPGGVLVYSTCTFSPEENEGSVSVFLEEHPEFFVKKTAAYEGFAPGRPEWIDARPETADTFRLWPHRLEGEGHFAAVLQKEGEAAPREFPWKMPSVDGSVRKLYQEFEKEALRCELPGILVLFGEQLYLLPEAFSLKGLKVLRPGLHLGTIKKNRFEPAHALALALKPHEAVRCCSLDVQEAGDYLKGAVFERKGEKGWQLMLADGYSIGWGKLAGGMVKNHYPKGLRKSI